LLGVLGVISESVAERVAVATGHQIYLIAASRPWAEFYLSPIQIWATQSIMTLLSAFLLLTLVRLLPLSGTHAAEHQVVHCVEQGVPLTVPFVRSMPRVHPRCGTNLLAGMMTFMLVFAGVFVVAQVKDLDTPDCIAVAAMIAAPVGLIYWRRIGAFLQYWFTTKPASEEQIVGAIKAAEQVLREREGRGSLPVKRPLLRRVWAMGLPQICIGYALVFMLVKLVTFCWPGLSSVLEIQ
jgi:hypothetical protein